MAEHSPFRFAVVPFSPPTSRAAWADLARAAEAHGFSTFIVGDHVAGGVVAPIAGLMAAAAATTTLRVGCHVFANDFRHPTLLAYEASSLDLLSDGRLELGLGSGWLGSDYTALGLALDPPGARIGRLEEAVRLIKRLFGETDVTVHGRYYRIENLTLQPKPVQQPNPPLMIGGGGMRVLSLAGRESDIVGLDPIATTGGTKDLATTSAAALAEKVGWVRAAAGARFAALELHLLLYAVRITDDRERAAEEVLRMWTGIPVFSNSPTKIADVLDSPHYLIGSPEQIVEQLQAIREQYGISYFSVPDFMGNVDALRPAVARLAGT